MVAKKTVNFTLRLWFGNIWVSRSLALIALLNFSLVLFDLSYVPWRDFWLLGRVRILSIRLGWFKSEGITLQLLPRPLSQAITQYYDPFKGIETHRETSAYLANVAKLEANLNRLNSPEVAKILATLRQESSEMIETNPFQGANKTGHLERIKNLMRAYVPNETNSSRQAFNTFWSQEYLEQDTARKLEFFNTRIKPLIYANFFRTLDENGQESDYFYLIDFPFLIIFLVDFLGRTFYLTRIYSGLKWREAMLWRWYDILLFTSFFRLLRIIPVTIRLQEARLINLEIVQKQVKQGFVSVIAKEVTMAVVLQIFNVIENSIDKVNVSNRLLPDKKLSKYTDLNGRDEIREITVLLINFILQEVLPKVKPDLHILLEYIVRTNIQEIAVYKQLKFLPGIESLQQQITTKIIDSLFSITTDTLEGMLKEDAIFDEYVKNVQNSLSQSIYRIQTPENSSKIKILLKDLVGEVKINYLKSVEEQEMI